jgi:UDP-2,3-diacylglucosamine pyrophosphatase LpxH
VEKVTADTLVLSDLHLGSEVSRARDALRLLKESTFARLVLLGDIFSDLNFGRLKKDHWQFLSYIRKLSNPKRGVEVVWVEGNHDHGLSDVMSHLVGIRVYQEYSWTYEGIRHLAVHGHQFDRFAINNAFLSRFGALIYLHLQKLDNEKKRFVRSLDGLNTRWLRLSAKVSEGALAHARQRGADRVFCGHTHVAMQKELGGITYFNSGCWVSARATYITVGAEGVRIHEYARTDDRYPREERSEADAEAIDFALGPDVSAEPQDEGVCC